MSQTIVLKFGGASVATPEHFRRVAQIVLRRVKEYPKVVVVVSAMGKMTDQLIELARRVNPQPPRREMDMLVSVGERISCSLLAMALEQEGQSAVSFTGSQSGIITSEDHNEATIIDVRPVRLGAHLDRGQVVIIAGFQGVSQSKEITTLGRGGSDTTAVAVGVALGACCVEFFKDVGGVYEKDPHEDPSAVLCPYLTYTQAAELVSQSSRPVLHPRAIRLARENGLPLRVLPFDHIGDGTTIVDVAVSARGTPIYEIPCH